MDSGFKMEKKDEDMDVENSGNNVKPNSNSFVTTPIGKMKQVSLAGFKVTPKAFNEEDIKKRKLSESDAEEEQISKISRIDVSESHDAITTLATVSMSTNEPTTPQSVNSNPKKLTPKQLMKRKQREEQLAEREKLKEEAKRLKMEELEQKRIEKEEKLKKKMEEKLKLQQEKALKKQLELDLKAEEKRIKDVEKKAKDEERRVKEEEKRAKEEEKRAKEEEKRLKEERDRKTKEKFTSFFIAKPKPKEEPVVVQQKTTFMPFEVKRNMKLAVIQRTVFDEERARRLDNVINGVGEWNGQTYLMQLKSKDYKPGHSDDTWPINSAYNNFITDDGTGFKSDAVFDDEMEGILKLRCKLLQFHENRRPAYRGTWRKRSKKITGRNPFKMDTDLLDYDVDSDDEWEEEEPGESLHGTDDEKEDSQSGDEDNYELDNSFFVPHGYLSADEGEGQSDQEDLANLSPEAKEMKFKHLDEEYYAECKEKTRLYPKSAYGIRWIDNSAFNRSEVNDDEANFLIRFSAVLNQPTPLNIVEYDENNFKQHPATPSNEMATSDKFSEEFMSDLIHFIHGKKTNLKVLAREFLEYLTGKDVKSMPHYACTLDKMREISSWSKNGDELAEFSWVVHKEVMEAYSLPKHAEQYIHKATPRPKAKFPTIIKFVKVMSPEDKKKRFEALATPSTPNGDFTSAVGKTTDGQRGNLMKYFGSSEAVPGQKSENEIAQSYYECEDPLNKCWDQNNLEEVAQRTGNESEFRGTAEDVSKSLEIGKCSDPDDLNKSVDLDDTSGSEDEDGDSTIEGSDEEKQVKVCVTAVDEKIEVCVMTEEKKIVKDAPVPANRKRITPTFLGPAQGRVQEIVSHVPKSVKTSQQPKRRVTPFFLAPLENTKVLAANDEMSLRKHALPPPKAETGMIKCEIKNGLDGNTEEAIPSNSVCTPPRKRIRPTTLSPGFKVKPND